MSKVFCIVEKKDKDLFTIYDTENKGVCCCSLYTLKDLVKQGCKINGFCFKNGKVSIQEVGLDGTPRVKKAPIICEDTTKRSAVTILKGLDEKHYPRVKQNRKGVLGEMTVGTVVDISYTCGDITTGTTGVIVKQQNKLMVMTLDGFLVQKEFIEDISKKQNITNYERIAFERMFKLCNMNESIYEERKNLEARLNKLTEKKIEIDRELSKVKQLYNKELYNETVIGNEEFKQSFHGGMLNKPYVAAVINKTKRPLLYTYGYTWKNPTTLRKSITKEQALDILNKASLLDVTATKDNIHLNEFSANDMW